MKRWRRRAGEIIMENKTNVDGEIGGGRARECERIRG